jgi:cell division cycle 2-like protein
VVEVDEVPPSLPVVGVVPERPDWLDGCRGVEKFERLNKIQEGTYGVVYRAKDKETGEIVALKKFKLEREKEGFPITALREISLLLQLQHPNVVCLKEIVVGGSHQNIYLVMEFLEHDLRDLMDEMKTPFLASEIKCLMRQLLSGVAFLHEHWVIHRDLKTSNLLLNNKGVLKLADFGLARHYGSPLKPYTHMVVTLWYRAPELLLGEKTYTPAIDMWSVGCIFAELLNKGEAVIQGHSEIDQLDKIFRLLGSPSEQIWPGFSKLPNAKNIRFSQYQPYNYLRKKVGPITELCFDLLNAMLTYFPKKRISAADAMRHAYWSESPRPQHPDMMPTFPSAHEGIKRRRHTNEEQLKEQEMARDDEERYDGARDREYEKQKGRGRRK